MSELVRVYLLVGLCTMPLVAGIDFADRERMIPSRTVEACNLSAGQSWLPATLALLGWPVVVPEMYLLTGFAQSGWMLPMPATCRHIYNLVKAMNGAGKVDYLGGVVRVPPLWPWQADDCVDQLHAWRPRKDGMCHGEDAQ